MASVAVMPVRLFAIAKPAEFSAAAELVTGKQSVRRRCGG
jgi:hypothetical protein